MESCTNCFHLRGADSSRMSLDSLPGSACDLHLLAHQLHPQRQQNREKHTPISNVNVPSRESHPQLQQLVFDSRSGSRSPLPRGPPVSALNPNCSLSLSTPNLLLGHPILEQRSTAARELREHLVGIGGRRHLELRATDRRSANGGGSCGSLFHSSDAIDHPPSPTRFDTAARRAPEQPAATPFASSTVASSQPEAATNAMRPSTLLLGALPMKSTAASGGDSSAAKEGIGRTGSVPSLPQVGAPRDREQKQPSPLPSASGPPAPLSARGSLGRLTLWQSVHELGDESQDAKRLERAFNMLSK